MQELKASQKVIQIKICDVSTSAQSVQSMSTIKVSTILRYARQINSNRIKFNIYLFYIFKYFEIFGIQIAIDLVEKN